MARATFPVVVHTLLFRGPRLLLLERTHTGFMDGLFCPPGGHQRHGESVTEAAMRECAEEAGSTVTELDPVCVLPYRSGRHQGLNFVFASDQFAGEPYVAEPELFGALVWAEPEALPEATVPWLDDVLELRSSGGWFRELHWR